MNTLWKFFLLLFFTLLHAQQYNNEEILLDQVKVLTFAVGKMTTGRRNSPISQLQCVGGSASYQSQYFPTSVQCTNVGTDSYGEVQWECKADLDSSVRFGPTVVSCEGYSSPNDPYILRGSCGLEYQLEFIGQGQNQNGGYGSSYPSQDHHHYNRVKQVNWGNVFMIVIFGIILVGIFLQCSQNSTRNAGNFDAGTNYGSDSGSDPYSQPPRVCPPRRSSSWTPGFWTGFGSGGLLGYLFRPRPYDSSYGGYRRSGFSSSRSSSRSFGTRTSSAFASTKRR